MDEIMLSAKINGPVGVQGPRLVEVLTGRLVATCADLGIAAQLAALINKRLAEEMEDDAHA